MKCCMTDVYVAPRFWLIDEKLAILAETTMLYTSGILEMSTLQNLHKKPIASIMLVHAMISMLSCIISLCSGTTALHDTPFTTSPVPIFFVSSMSTPDSRAASDITHPPGMINALPLMFDAMGIHATRALCVC